MNAVTIWIIIGDTIAFGGLILVFVLVPEMFIAAWHGLMNGTAWIVEHTFGKALRTVADCQVMAAEMRTTQLERWSDQYTEIRFAGDTPWWHEKHGWVAAEDVCPCGYVTECGVWCGPGHMNGRCEKSDHRHTAPEFGETPVQLSPGAAEYLRRAGTTGDELAEWIKAYAKSGEVHGGR